HLGDRIRHSSGANVAKAAGAFNSTQPHIDIGRSIRVPIVDATGLNPAGVHPSDNFVINGFVIIKLIGYGNDNFKGNFLVAEVVRPDTSCGQVLQ
ncbi:MAG: hypothetical protein AAGD96_28800, partial [Chloroflexota bacterium]